MHFVFVTPRNWPGKNEWAGLKDPSGDWKAVRVCDASDLEQWLETAVAPRIWLADELRMTAAVFAPSLARHRRAFREWLIAPSDRPFTVAADSKEEAVAITKPWAMTRPMTCTLEDGIRFRPEGGD